MADDFVGVASIELQPATAGAPYTFSLPACSGVGTNDGRLPYGDSIVSVIVTAHTAAGVDVTAELISGTPTVTDGEDITVALNYPATTGPGRYHLRFVYTLDSGVVDEVDFNKIMALDR